MSSGKRKLKRDSTTCQLGWLKSSKLTTPNADKDEEQQELSYTAGGMQNGTATLENNLALSAKTKPTFII